MEDLILYRNLLHGICKLSAMLVKAPIPQTFRSARLRLALVNYFYLYLSEGEGSLAPEDRKILTYLELFSANDAWTFS